MRRRERHCFSSYSYIKNIYKENPIKMRIVPIGLDVQLLLFYHL